MQRVDRSLVKTAPKGPGVYFMYSDNGLLLYVGKAKSLRKRLASYWRRSSEESRKLERMKRVVTRVEWQETESEKAALLLENSLLREHRPFFNVFNTRPENYPYLIFSRGSAVEGRILCRLYSTRKPKALTEKDALYGAFRSRRLPGLTARTIFRLMKILQSSRQRWMLLSKIEISALKAFLAGTRSHFVSELYGKLWEHGCFEDPLMAKQLDSDFTMLRLFFENCARKNFKIKRDLGLDSALIEQDKVDDLIVEMNFKE
ncbi:MAG: GIY-YIG nuclease family protein [Bdellovibrionota bacterium]